MPKTQVHTEPDYFAVVENDIGYYGIALFVKEADNLYRNVYLLGEYPNKDAKLEAANQVASRFKLGTWYRDTAMGFTKEGAEQALHAVQLLLNYKPTKTVKQLLPKKCQVTVPVLYDIAGNPTCQTPKKTCPFFMPHNYGFNTGGSCSYGKPREAVARVPMKEGSQKTSYHPCEECPVHGTKGVVTREMAKFNKAMFFVEREVALRNGVKQTLTK